jgi:uncharacterized membrane protein YvlD (DUF360 family)
MAVLLLTVAMFAAVFNAYVVSLAQGLRGAEEAARLLASASARIENVTVNGTSIEGYIVNTGSAGIIVAEGAVLVVRYNSSGKPVLDVLSYPSGWSIDVVTAAGVSRQVEPGAPVTLEPGEEAHFVASLSQAPDSPGIVVVVFASPRGVVARGTGSA